MKNPNPLLHRATLILAAAFLVLAGCSSNENYTNRGYVISQSQIESDAECPVANESLNQTPE